MKPLFIPGNPTAKWRGPLLGAAISMATNTIKTEGY